MPNTPPFVVVGLSGGVDSSVAALLLQQQGYRVEGLFMKNWEEDDADGECPAARDARDAQAVADKLGIPLHHVNFAKDYWDNVFEYFLNEYQAGRTPNPDILCNKYIKFKAFLDHAKNLGADYIATGHYARIEQRDDEFHLLKGVDNNKDQTYFLYTLNQSQLANSLFPVGEYEKPRIRDIARDAGFITHDKKDSTGICFIGEKRFKDFLSQYLLTKPGNIETPEGKVIGRHDGLMYHTLGQRKGLNIGGLREADDLPWYVAQKDVPRNVLIAVQGEDHPLLLSDTLHAAQCHWVADKPPTLPLQCKAKVRYRQVEQACTLSNGSTEGTVTVQFETPQRAVTPGQSVVFYLDDDCLGGAVIL